MVTRMFSWLWFFVCDCWLESLYKHCWLHWTDTVCKKYPQFNKSSLSNRIDETLVWWHKTRMDPAKDPHAIALSMDPAKDPHASTLHNTSNIVQYGHIRQHSRCMPNGWCDNFNGALTQKLSWTDTARVSMSHFIALSKHISFQHGSQHSNNHKQFPRILRVLFKLYGNDDQLYLDDWDDIDDASMYKKAGSSMHRGIRLCYLCFLEMLFLSVSVIRSSDSAYCIICVLYLIYFLGGNLIAYIWCFCVYCVWINVLCVDCITLSILISLYLYQLNSYYSISNHTIT